MDKSLVPIGDDNIEISRVGLIIKGDISFEDWQDIGYTLGKMERAFRWAIADWIVYGEWKYGETYAQAMDVTGFEYGYLANLASVARKIHISLRREELGLSKHQLVAKLDPEFQKAWLDAAVEKDWTRSEMVDAMRNANLLPASSPVEQKGSILNEDLVSLVVRYIKAKEANKREIWQQAYRDMKEFLKDEL